MKLYIDKSNLISLVNSKNSPEFLDCADLIRRHFDVKYNFPKDDVKAEEHLMAWFSKYGQGVGGNALYFSKDEIKELSQKKTFAEENVSHYFGIQTIKPFSTVLIGLYHIKYPKN